jgi:hypothetical protein
MDDKTEYSIRRKAAEDMQAEMESRRKTREARRAQLLIDSLDIFYAQVAGGYGASPVDITNPYVKNDYDQARTEIATYLKGGEMPWIKRRPSRKEQEEARRLARLNLSLGTPIDKKPLALEEVVDLTNPPGRREVRRMLRAWRDWGNMTVIVYTATDRIFKFVGRLTLVQGRYMVSSREGKNLALQDMMDNPGEFEPPIEKLGFMFERRSSGKAWDGYIR